MISDRTSRNSTSSLESVRSELSKVYSPPAIYDTAGERLGSFHNSRRSSLISGSGDDGYRDIANVEYALVKRLTQTEEPASVECNRKQEECAEATIGQCGDKEAHLAVDGLVSDDSELDKGFAWVIAFCSMLAVFAAWGWTTAFGVFLSYFMSSNYFPGATDYDFALIGSMAVGFGQLFSPMTVLSYRIFGPYCTSGFGIFIQVIALILASFATKIWQLYVTLGLMGGLAIPFICLPGAFMFPTWFAKKKATAMGISLSGAGLGGLFFSLVVQRLILITGDHKWALRMCAIVNFVVALVACSILKPRNYMPIPLKTTLRKEYIWTNLKSVFGIQAFKKDYSLILLGLWYGLSLFGYIIVLFTVSPYAIQVGLSAKQASILTAVLSATQVIGRPSMGIIADKVGRYNYVIFISIIISIFIWAYWINATTFGALVGFSILIGFSHGIGAVFCQPLASDLLDDSEQIPTVWSTLNITVSAFCMSSEVIAMKLRNNEVSNPYIGTQVFSGACFLGCAFFALLIREKVVKKSMNSKIQKLKEGNDLDTELAKELQDLETLVGSQSFAIGYLRRTFYPIKV